MKSNAEHSAIIILPSFDEYSCFGSMKENSFSVRLPTVECKQNIYKLVPHASLQICNEYPKPATTINPD